MNSITKALHTNLDISDAYPTVTPLFQNSAFQAHSPYFYTRKDNPNIKEFETILKELENCKYGIAVTTGMAAIATVLNLLKPGSTLVVNKYIYGCSFKLFLRFCKRMNIKLVAIDLTDKSHYSQIPAETGMVFFETPTNPFLYTVDISALSAYVKKMQPNSLIVVDNTWATPLFQKPLQLGADISLHSGTKYFSGHSDVMGGIILVDDDALYEEIKNGRFYTGAILDPHSAWMMVRSLQTLPIRMKAHHETTLILKEYLEKCPQVIKVFYPEVDGRQLTNYGTLIFFTIRDDLVESYPMFAQTLQLFSTGTGMACVTSMIAQPYTGSHASMSPEEKAEMGLGKNLIRLSFGLEDPEDLKEDLANAFRAIMKE